MNLLQLRQQFEANKRIYESAKLVFHGVEDFDVYNPTIPFEWNGKRYIYGRLKNAMSGQGLGSACSSRVVRMSGLPFRTQ